MSTSFDQLIKSKATIDTNTPNNTAPGFNACPLDFVTVGTPPVVVFAAVVTDPVGVIVAGGGDEPPPPVDVAVPEVAGVVPEPTHCCSNAITFEVSVGSLVLRQVLQLASPTEGTASKMLHAHASIVPLQAAIWLRVVERRSAQGVWHTEQTSPRAGRKPA